jgi:hypothetical protein
MHEMNFNLPTYITINHASNLKFVLVVHQFFNYIKMLDQKTLLNIDKFIITAWW